MELVSEKVERFSLLGHTFIWLEPDTTTKIEIRSGFYDLLYDGQLKIIARRSKDLQKVLESTTLTIKFDEKVQYLILKNGTYFSVKNKASVLSALEDRKKDLKQFIARNHINFKDRENTLIRLAEFYETQKN